MEARRCFENKGCLIALPPKIILGQQALFASYPHDCGPGIDWRCLKWHVPPWKWSHNHSVVIEERSHKSRWAPNILVRTSCREVTAKCCSSNGDNPGYGIVNIYHTRTDVNFDRDNVNRNTAGKMRVRKRRRQKTEWDVETEIWIAPHLLEGGSGFLCSNL